MGANNKKAIKGYLSAIENETGVPTETGSSSEATQYILLTFHEFAYGRDSRYDGDERIVCAGFWVRRSIDGTADEFYELLKLTMNTFDAEFLKK